MFKRYFVTLRNIPWTVCHHDLEKYFTAFGNIRHARVVFGNNGMSTGYGFVEFKDKLGIQNVLNTTHVLEEKKIFVTEGIAFTQHEGLKNALQTYMSMDNIAQYTTKNHMDE